ncbi:MAG: UvrD-helicase domain-containing protein, partial [Candidatus Rokubacteria bacterium]|nr:UvrD-helicase domain-containing protein [Candidatus Rokubacteria bacterium]
MTGLEKILDDLNSAQREAVTAGEGPLLVLAGAGSGKTRVITYRIAHLIGLSGVAARHVVAVTFTNKAAGEMARRVETLLRPAGIKPPIISTFHSLAVRMLRQNIHHIGRSNQFVIYDEDDRLAIVKDCVKGEEL